MPIIHIDELGRGGIDRDPEPYTLAPHIWSGGQNIRFIDTRVQKSKGSAEFFETWNVPAWSYTAAQAVPLWLLPWNDGTDANWVAPSATKIAMMQDGATTDVTRTSGGNYGGDSTTIWSGGVLGGVPIVNNDSGDNPQSWNGGTSKFQDLPNWTSGDAVRIMRVFKQYLIGYDYTPNGGTREPHTVKWSNPALPGTVPTKWDNADDNDSNEQPLSEGGGFILDAQPLRDFMVVYKEDQTYLQQLVNTPFVFQFRRIFDHDGILAPRCAKTFNGVHFVVTQGDVKVHNGQTIDTVINKKNRTWLFNNIHQDTIRQTYVVPNYRENEMWICFISESVAGSYADRALVWNWKDGTWGVRDLPDCPHIGFGRVEDTGISKIIDDQEQIINNDDNLIDGAPFGTGEYILVGSSLDATNSKLLKFDLLNQEFGTDMTSYVERVGMAMVGRDQFGQWKVDPTSTKFFRRLWLKMEATAAVDVYVGVQQRLEGAVSWSGPHSFLPGTTPHIDVRLHGKALALKIASDDDVAWSCTGASFDMEIIGGETR